MKRNILKYLDFMEDKGNKAAFVASRRPSGWENMVGKGARQGLRVFC